MNEMNNTEYYIIFDVNPKDYVDVSIYALNYSHILLRKLIQCGFTKIYNVLFATRNNIRSINGFGEKQIEIFESELAHYLNKNIEANDNDKDTICSISEQKYSQLYNVNPDTFCDIDLSVLKLQRGFICRLNECGFSNVGSLLKSARKDIIRFHGIGEKQIITLEKELKSYLVKTGAVSLAKEDSVSVKEALMYENMSYYQIFSVDPDDYTEVDISVLQITPGIRMRLAQNGYTTVRALLKSKRSELLLVKGVGVKQIDRIETDLKTFLASGVENNPLPKTVSKVIIENRQHIISGDFSFKNNVDDENLSIVEKYEEAYECLGTEIVSDIMDKPLIYFNLTRVIAIISDKYRIYSNVLKQVEQSLELVPKAYITKPSYSFILAALSKDDSESLFKMGDMKSIKLGALPYILNFGMKKEADLITQVLKRAAFDFDTVIDKLMKELHKNEMQKIVLEMRSTGYTLDQIGQQYQKTRERIRQIEARAKRYFDHWNANSKIMYYVSAFFDSKEVVSCDDVLSVFGQYAEELLYLLKASDQRYYYYASDVDCFILGNRSKLDEAIAVIQKLPDLISDDDIAKFADIQYQTQGIDKDVLMIALKSVYKKTEKTYHKSNLNSSKVYLFIIQKYYPEGIMLYDDAIMNDFRRHIKEEFGEEYISANDRAVRARIIDNCIMCDKGKYMIRKESYISEELLYDIVFYIDNEEKSVIMLNTVFTLFRNRLLSVGIDNRYFLQGVLKEELSDRYSFSRDYIFKDGNIKSFYKEIVNYIQKFDYPITKKQIFDYFPGITEIVLNFSVSDESIINFFGEYLHGSRLNLNDDDIKYLYNAVDELSDDCGAHHGKELYEIISKDNPTVLNKAGIFHAYSLFSVVEYLFRNEFQFSRPYFAKNNVEFSKPLEIIEEWVKAQNLISIKDITAYAKELKYQVYSILELMNSYNDSHLLIDSESIASFEYIGITQIIAEEVESIIVSDISGTMLVSNLACISKLPKLNVPWSEWLIYSILLKWGNKTDLAVTNKYFYYAHPVVALKGKIDISQVEIEANPNMNGSEFKIDDLDNIDDLIADALDDELFEDLL